MLAPIKRLGTDTAIYGTSTIIGRFLNFLLVPFYTNVLHPGDYGIVAYLYSIMAFLNIMYMYGMESAYFKFTSTGEIGNAKQNFSTPFISLAASSAVFSGLILALSTPVQDVLGIPPEHASVIPCAAGILFLDTVAIVPFACLRMERKPGLFAVLKILNIVVNVSCNLVLLLVYHRGVEGIFLSGLIASAFTVVTLLPTILRHFAWDFSPSLYRALLAFGLPYIPAGLATMVVQVIDRPLMRFLTDDATVGVYQANYRLGIIMMLIVSMYDYAWRPFFLSHAKDPDAKKLFARALTYFVVVSSGIFLVISLFIGDIVRIEILGRHLIHPDYWGGLTIVPVVLLAYIFLGIYNNLIAGIYIENKTKRLPAITAAAAGVNILVNFLLIPRMGMMGAAVATLMAYVVMAAVMYVTVQGFYPVQYEWGRIMKIALAVAVSYIAFLLIPGADESIALKCGLLVLFCLLVLLMKFLVPGEIRTLRDLVKPGPVG